jgi:ABC-type cobalamin/Fe3+-siderophores transport system ATPase subunit
MTSDISTSTPTTGTTTRVRADGLRVGYGDRMVLDGIDLRLPDGAITAIVGPNGCGKSTLLRSVGRVLSPAAGAVLLDGRPVHTMSTRHVARAMGLLPQSNVVPEQLTVRDLVERGRFPHRGAFSRWTSTDQAAVDEALAVTGTAELTDRVVDELSGGQRQRAWIAMVLAQQTPILLLDEPTTYLDLAHRLEVLRLLRSLNNTRAVTVAMVLHDLDEACRYADHLVAMYDGAIIAEGPPSDVVTPDLVQRVFGVECLTIPDPVTGTPLVIPR